MVVYYYASRTCDIPVSISLAITEPSFTIPCLLHKQSTDTRYIICNYSSTTISTSTVLNHQQPNSRWLDYSSGYHYIKPIYKYLCCCFSYGSCSIEHKKVLMYKISVHYVLEAEYLMQQVVTNDKWQKRLKSKRWKSEKG